MYLIIQHKVRDFENWQKEFKAHGKTRKSHGQKSENVYRNASNDSDVVVVLEFDSEKNIKAFISDPSLRSAMDKAGVKGEPMLIISDTADFNKLSGSRQGQHPTH